MNHTNRHEPLEDAGLNDSGRLLVVLDAAGTPPSLEVDEDRLDSYLYLLNRAGVLPLGYSFTFEPLPFSSQLWTDVTLMRELKFIASGSRSLVITNEGKAWLRERLGRADDHKAVAATVREHLDTYVKWDMGTLFRAIYYQATAS